MFRRLMNIIAMNPELNDTDKIIGFMSYSDLVFKYNQINRHLLEVNKP